MTLTALDGFCGAGGSSTGMVAAGIEVKMAINHWQMAIDTHQTNHPNTDHDRADLQATHPSSYPRTDILWMSPECTSHSISKGKRRKNIGQQDLWGNTQVDPAEERSRATMREVVEFAAYHRHEIVIVENVVDIHYWEHLPLWLTTMHNLGYDHKAIYLNAQFFGVPQSRDRIYVIFWRKGNRAPDLEFRPPAVCPKHGNITALQVWKRQDKTWGRYGKHGQYLFRCPQCGAEVKPIHAPAWSVIDWSLPAPRVGDRKHPLEDKTRQRIQAGLNKFARPVVMDTLYQGGIRPTDEPMQTQTTRQSFALALPPFITSQHNNTDGTSTRVRAIDEPLPCVTTFNNEHALVVPPFMAILKNSWSADGTYTLPPRAMDEPLTTVVASASQHALIMPPFMTEYYGTGGARSLEEGLATITAEGTKHGLTIPPFLAAYYGNGWSYAVATDAMPTVETVQRHALIIPDAMVDECGFRMLEPEELKRGMSFPDDYVILGNKRQQVRQIGNAVCANVAEWIARRCVESLEVQS